LVVKEGRAPIRRCKRYVRGSCRQEDVSVLLFSLGLSLTQDGSRRCRTGRRSHWPLLPPKVRSRYPAPGLMKENNRYQHKIGSCPPALAVDSPLTVATSSPGTTLRRSPVAIKPETTRPAAAIPEAMAVWPLNTFVSGMRNGASTSRVGGSRVSRTSNTVGILLPHWPRSVQSSKWQSSDWVETFSPE
jgi:hypothetical protein